MKRFILAAAMAFVSMMAQADVIIVEGSHADVLHGKPNSNGFLMKYGKAVNKDLEVDVLYQTTQTYGTNAMSTRIETGVTPSYDLGWAKAYTRVVVGEKFNTTGNFTFYSHEPGLVIPLGGGFSTKIGYRFRNAFQVTNLDRTNTARVGLSYAFTANDSINLRRDQVRGDQEQNIWALSYVRNF